MTDVLIYQTDDGGDIIYENGRVILEEGLESAVYLSLFGGNEDDGGGEDTQSIQYWGNLIEPDPANHYRSETQFLLRNIPANTGNLLRLSDAITRDLSWMLDELANNIEVNVSIPDINEVRIDIDVEVNGDIYPFTFTETWDI